MFLVRTGINFRTTSISRFLRNRNKKKLWLDSHSNHLEINGARMCDMKRQRELNLQITKKRLRPNEALEIDVFDHQ